MDHLRPCDDLQRGLRLFRHHHQQRDLVRARHHREALRSLLHRAKADPQGVLAQARHGEQAVQIEPSGLLHEPLRTLRAKSDLRGSDGARRRQRELSGSFELVGGQRGFEVVGDQQRQHAGCAPGDRGRRTRVRLLIDGPRPDRLVETARAGREE
ncbi:MAG: hypothetical protein ACYTEG_02290 [Planctomycetota bacterium]